MRELLRVQLEYRYVALLDVLGYIEGLDRDRREGSLEFGNKLYQAQQESIANINMSEFNFDFISDTMIITCADEANFIDFLRLLKKISISYLKAGIFLRGVVVYDQHLVRNVFIYSHAVSKAAKLEREMMFPRIIVDKNIVEMTSTSDVLSQLIKDEIICIENGIFFINIIDNSNWKLIYNYAYEIFSRNKVFISGSEVQFTKHTWFENYIFSSSYADPNYLRYIPRIKPIIDHNFSPEEDKQEIIDDVNPI